MSTMEASAGATTVGDVSVASAPKRHAYTRHIGWFGDGVTRVAEPDECYSAAAMMNPDWIGRNQHRFECFHVHFGFGDLSISELEDFVGALRSAGKPLVYTVHDLANPHLEDQRHHLHQVELFMKHADEVVTLTHDASEAIKKDYGRSPVVIAHPHVLDLHSVGRPRETRQPVVGLHLKCMRSAVLGSPMVLALSKAVREREDLSLRVDIHPEPMRTPPQQDQELPEVLRTAERRGEIDLHVEPYLSDAGFDAYLRSIDIAVLPYRWGTHSGWAEACLDAGVVPVAPAHTCIPGQHPSIVGCSWDDDSVEPDDLAPAIDHAVALLRSRPLWTATDRRAQRQAVARAHRNLYDRVVSP